MFRKKNLLFLFLSLLSLPSFAQNQMSVVSFEYNQMDLTANTKGSIIYDQNAEKCGLIKVVTTLKGFNFDVGTLGVQSVQEKDAETWVYVPHGVKKISISHPRYGQTEYLMSKAIEKGATYVLVLDPGVGKYMNITSNISGAVVYMDNDSIGVTPIANTYIMYGSHNIIARKGKMEAEQAVNVTKNSDEAVSLTLQDQSFRFGKVAVNVVNNAEIYFNGQKMAIGRWETELKEGDYVVETRKDGCSNSTSSIHVTGGRNNVFNVDAPTPYHGYLKIHTIPRALDIADVTNGDARLTGEISNQVNVGKHILSFSKRGYYSMEKEYSVERNVESTDTIELRSIDYLKSKTFYLGAGVNVSSLTGATVIAGGTLFNFDVEVGYTLGLVSTSELSWYDNSTGDFTSRMTYKQNTFHAKLGYLIKASKRIGFVPQVGFASTSFSGKTKEGNGKLGDGESNSYITAGCRVMWVPAEHVNIFVTPEYHAASGDKPLYKAICKSADISDGGFHITAGLLFNF